VDELIKILINRLVNKGMEVTSIPAYVRDLANTMAEKGNLGPGALNRRLEMLGWDDFTLDEYTLELVTAMFEQDVEYKSPSWFARTFSSYSIDDSIDAGPFMAGRREKTDRASEDMYGTKR
jgi:hypothetical protein